MAPNPSSANDDGSGTAVGPNEGVTEPPEPEPPFDNCPITNPCFQGDENVSGKELMRP